MHFAAKVKLLTAENLIFKSVYGMFIAKLMITKYREYSVKVSEPLATVDYKTLKYIPQTVQGLTFGLAS